MKLKLRSTIQLIITIIVIISCTIYGMYINEIIDFRLLSVGDLNPYGGWSALKSALTDLSYRWRGFSRGTALTAGIVLTALFLGRFFCGYFCPIGAIQDFFKNLGNKLGLKEINLSPKFEIIKYLVLISVIALSIMGLGNLVSPYSPWLAYLNIFIGFNLQAGTVILILISLISLVARRVFCRYFCPLGAFQSLLYAIGPFKIKKSECNCSYCLKTCPVSEELRVSDKEKHLSPECINCLNCIETCVKGTEGFQLKIGNKLLKKKTYVTLCITILLAAYILLPLTGRNSAVQAISTFEEVIDGVYTGSGMGFGGIMNVEVTINNQKITSIKVLNHSETSGYYQEVFRSMAYEIVETQNLSADAVSGATSTSRGFLNSVRDAVSKSLDN